MQEKDIKFFKIAKIIEIIILAAIFVTLIVFGCKALTSVKNIEQDADRVSKKAVKVLSNFEDVDVDTINEDLDLLKEKLEILNMEELNSSIENISSISGDIDSLNESVGNTWDNLTDTISTIGKNISESINQETSKISKDVKK